MDLDQVLAAAVADARVDGAVAMVGSRDGVRWAGAVGVRDVATGAPMTLGTVFQIASMTKAVVTAAALQQVERGALSLDAPIAEVAPEIAGFEVLDGFAADGSPRLRPPARPITLRHLLTHTSGLGYDFFDEGLQRARAANPPTPGSRAWLGGPLLFDPGAGWAYGTGIDFAGFAVEAVTGQRLDAYVAREITGPLGMADTGFDPAAPRAGPPVTLSARQEDGTLVPFPMVIGGGVSGEYISGGGGLFGTAADYMRFQRMILNGGSLDGARILKPGTVAEMARNQIGALRAGAIPTVNPALSHAVDVFPGMDAKWGLGFIINPDPGPHGRAPGSLAWAGLANCYYWIDPASDVAGVILMQFLPFADPGAQAAYAAFERAVYGV